MASKTTKPLKAQSLNPDKAALFGFLLALPIGLLWSAIVFEITPLEAFLKSIFTDNGDQPHAFGYAFMAFGLIALPFALGISLWPMLRKGVEGKRHLYIINLLLSLIIFVLILNTWGELAEEIYRCDILHIPNCD